MLDATHSPLARGLSVAVHALDTYQRRLEVAHRRVTGHPQHIPFATLAQLVTKPCVAPQLIVTRHLAVWHLLSPRVEHLQALLVPRVIPHLRWDVALLTPLCILCPVLRQ